MKLERKTKKSHMSLFQHSDAGFDLQEKNPGILNQYHKTQLNSCKCPLMLEACCQKGLKYLNSLLGYYIYPRREVFQERPLELHVFVYFGTEGETVIDNKLIVQDHEEWKLKFFGACGSRQTSDFLGKFKK